MVPEKVGAYFYTSRKEPGAKERRKAKKWARIQPLLDRFVPRKE